MKIWIKLAVKELLNDTKFSVFFIANLILGLMGFIALDSFKLSLEHHLNLNSKALLTADISFLSYTPFEEPLIQELTGLFNAPYEESRQIS